MHSSLHLERIGDQAVNVAKVYQVTKDMPRSATIVQQIGEMGDIVVEMVRVAMDALRRRDLELCPGCKKMDDPSTAEPQHALRGRQARRRPARPRLGMHMNLAARALERVGDNAVDIGEQVSFLVSGEFREFTDASTRAGVSAADVD